MKVGAGKKRAGNGDLEPRSRIVLMQVLLVVVTLLFFAMFFNRFSGLRSGDGEYTVGVEYLNGVMPYRDYFTTAPPLNILKSALILKIFGMKLVVSRMAGVAERLVIALVLFRWLRQMFRAEHALLASLVTMIVSAGDRSDPIASYNHDAIFYAMAAGLAASFVLRVRQRRWKLLLSAGLSGWFAAMSLLTKQTIGLGVTVGIGVAVAILIVKLDGWRRAMGWCCGYVAGFSAPIVAVAVYLWRMGLLGTFFQMLFVKGPAAKASHPSDFLLRDVQIGWDNIGWVTLAAFALLRSWRAVNRTSWRATPVAGDSIWKGVKGLGWIFGVGLAILSVGWLLAMARLPALHDFSKSSVYYTFIGLTLLLLLYVWNALKPMSRRQAQCVLMCTVGWSVAFMLSLSWPAFEAMLLPGLGFLLAAALDGVGSRWRWALYGSTALMVFMQVREKLDLPFGFDFQDDAPVVTAVRSSVQPQLSGMLLSEGTVRFLDETVAVIEGSTSSHDRIFTYPELGILYALTNRRPPTVALSHNIDVMNDSFAHEEAARLMAAPPAVIVYYRESKEQVEGAERTWRRGRPGGQRYLIDAIERLIAGYRLAGSYRLAPGDPEIDVYVRDLK